MPRNATNTRNNALFDSWRIVHLTFGIGFGWLLEPAAAIALLVLWEPIEIFILSPLLARIGIIFGHESLRNSLSDIFFDLVGVTVSALLLPRFIDLF